MSKEKKEYLMFVDERGYQNNGHSFSMIGVVIESRYCTDSDMKLSEMSDKIERFKKQMLNNIIGIDVKLSDILSTENVYSNEFGSIVDEFVADLPMFLKGLKFSIISTCIKQDKNKTKDLYMVAANNLIKRYYSFLTNKQAKSGGIIVQNRHDKENQKMPQKFFDIYNDRDVKFYMYSDIRQKINKFMICESYNKEYKNALDLSNSIENILLNVISSTDEKLIDKQYGNINKIIKVLKNKTFKEEVDLLNENTQKHIDTVMDKYLKESDLLKQKLSVNEKQIRERDKEISILTEEIMRLKQQLSSASKNRKSDNMIYDILSDVDVKIKGIEKQTLVNVKN